MWPACAARVCSSMPIFSDSRQGEATAPGGPTHDVLVGRQPIFDRDLKVVAYELLFRAGTADGTANFSNADQATAHVLINTFVEIGLDTVVGNKRAFLNFTRDFLTQDYGQVFPPDRVVLEVLEDVAVDEDLIQGIRSLVERGYTIALDDFTHQENLLPLLEFAKIVKVDLPAVDPSEMAEHVASLRKREVLLLAEKVETEEEFEECKRLGFDYFQGFFLCRPKTVSGRRSPTNRLAVFHLLAELKRPDVEFTELGRLIMSDAVLSYKLLRLSNSALFAHRYEFTSIEQAVRYLGKEAIGTWAGILLLSRLDDKPPELLNTALLRALMCEELGIAMASSEGSAFFVVGLFSLLDALLNRPMPELLASLPLADGIKEALLCRGGPMGEALRCTENYERGHWEEIEYDGLGRPAIVRAYLNAVQRAGEISTAL